MSLSAGRFNRVRAIRAMSTDFSGPLSPAFAAFLFMPVLGDGVRTAGDIGMYAQTFLLSNRLRMHRLPLEQSVVLHGTSM